jgi:hypothetical protein
VTGDTDADADSDSKQHETPVRADMLKMHASGEVVVSDVSGRRYMMRGMLRQLQPCA